MEIEFPSTCHACGADQGLYGEHWKGPQWITNPEARVWTCGQCGARLLYRDAPEYHMRSDKERFVFLQQPQGTSQ